MQMDDSVLTLSGFRQELSNLNHLLSATLSPSFPMPDFDSVDQPVSPPDARQAKICSQILPLKSLSHKPGPVSDIVNIGQLLAV